MSDQNWGVLLGLAVFIALRLLDYTLPKGRYFKMVEKYTKQDEDEGEDDTPSTP